jgi:hypothetical protein
MQSLHGVEHTAERETLAKIADGNADRLQKT